MRSNSSFSRRACFLASYVFCFAERKTTTRSVSHKFTCLSTPVVFHICHCLPIHRSATKTRAKSASARVVLSGIRSHLGHAAFFLLRLLLAFVFRHDFNGGLFSRLCILLFSLGFRQDAVTERLDRSILRHYGKKRPRQHTRCVNYYSFASRRVVAHATSRVVSNRAN